VVKNNINGFILNEEAGVNEYEKLIIELLDDKNRMKILSESSFIYYKEKLNWNNFIERFSSICNELVK